MSNRSIVLSMAVQNKKIISSFKRKMIQKGMDECWIWQAALGPKGHGIVYIGTVDGIEYLTNAHRFSWTYYCGEIPDGLHVLHDCPGGDNPSCVNPNHLWLGTNDDNIRDMNAKGRHRCGTSKTPVDQCKYKRGADHHACKLNADIVRKMRSDKQSMSYAKIAKKYEIPWGTAVAAITKRTWKHVL